MLHGGVLLGIRGLVRYEQRRARDQEANHSFSACTAVLEIFVILR